jgi:uncharacterized protein YggE
MGRSMGWAVVSGAIVMGSAWPAHAQECTAASGHHVRVQGSAVVRLPPDRVSFSVGVETVNANVSQAFRANAQKVASILDALKAKGVRSAEIQTSNLDVSSRNPDGTPAKGYRVSNRVIVSREDAAGVGELIEAAVGAGANDAGQLNFYVADPSKAQGRGLELAFASARAKAETLARLAGQALGEPICVTEGPARDYATMNSVRFAGNAQMSVEPGTEALTFAVEVVFALKQ